MLGHIINTLQTNIKQKKTKKQQLITDFVTVMSLCINTMCNMIYIFKKGDLYLVRL